METREAIGMAKAKLKCIEKSVTGMDKFCNNNRCDECELNYDQGNMGEQREWLKESISAMEKQMSKKVELWNDADRCPACHILFGPRDLRKNLISWKMDYCKYCGQKLDWSDDDEQDT